MKKTIFLIIALTIALFSCSTDNSENSNDKKTTLNFTFNHYWETTPISSEDFNQIKFTNKNGEKLSIERLRYIISNIILTDNNGNTFSFEDYNLVDVTNDKNLFFSLSEKINIGAYQNITFTFGLRDDDNIDGQYQDLNVANFNVPAMLGGGYHYMQFDGTYLDNSNEETPFNYHAIRAANRTQTNPWENLPDTSFTVNLGNINIEKNTTINIDVNLAEWFKNPNTWNLNELNTFLMPNFEAQKLMNANGKSVFSLGEIN
jgi:hypothetical protein